MVIIKLDLGCTKFVQSFGAINVIAVLLFLVLCGKSAGAETSLEPSRIAAWQRYLEETEFRFTKAHASLCHSLERFEGDGQLQIICERGQGEELRLSFSLKRDGKDLLSVEGHLTSVFLTNDGKLFFAQFWPNRPGCTVRAFDMTTGHQLWESPELSGFRGFGASAYANQVLISHMRDPGVEVKSEPDAIVVTGRESFGDYISVVDGNSGALIARKVYRKDFQKYSSE